MTFKKSVVIQSKINYPWKTCFSFKSYSLVIRGHVHEPWRARDWFEILNAASKRKCSRCTTTWRRKKMFTQGIQRRLLKHYVNKKPNPLKTKLTIAYNFQCWGARVAQWWEHSPSSRVTRVRILASLNLLLFLSFAPSVFFSGYSGFPLSLKTNT